MQGNQRALWDIRLVRNAVTLDFSNFIVELKQKKSMMIVTVFDSLDFYDFRFPFSLDLVSIEKMYQTLKTGSNHISKHLDIRRKYSAVGRIYFQLRPHSLEMWLNGVCRV